MAAFGAGFVATLAAPAVAKSACKGAKSAAKGATKLVQHVCRKRRLAKERRERKAAKL